LACWYVPDQQFQRVFFHHAVGILSEKGFQSADFRGGVGLLYRTNVGVVFGGILDFLLLRLAGAGDACG